MTKELWEEYCEVSEKVLRYMHRCVNIREMWRKDSKSALSEMREHIKETRELLEELKNYEAGEMKPLYDHLINKTEQMLNLDSNSAILWGEIEEGRK